jgi:hypothetical protein
MQVSIKKSRLKQIIKEEVENFKFIEVREQTTDSKIRSAIAEELKAVFESVDEAHCNTDEDLEEVVAEEIAAAVEGFAKRLGPFSSYEDLPEQKETTKENWLSKFIGGGSTGDKSYRPAYDMGATRSDDERKRDKKQLHMSADEYADLMHQRWSESPIGSEEEAHYEKEYRKHQANAARSNPLPIHMVEELKEKADPSKMPAAAFPTKLSSVSQDVAKIVTTRGSGDGDKQDDVIDVTPNATFPVSKLKPSQTSMKISNAMGMALSMILGKMKTGGNLGGFISSDGHIMDGHHRWVATAMVDPSKEVGGYLVDFPGKELISILNAITSGRLGITKGKEGSGGFDQFQEEPIRKMLTALATKGSEHLSKEEVMEAIQKFTGKTGAEGVEAAVAKFVANLKNVKFQIPAGAPARVDMPVIDPDKVAGADKIAAKAMASGEIDVNPPFSDDTKKALKIK